MVDVTTGLAFLTGLGLPEVLLWVLSFAVVFAILTKLKIFSRAPAALVSIVIGFFVLLAVPATLISIIASMSTGLIALATGLIVLVALMEVAKPSKEIGKTKEGVSVYDHWFTSHSTVTGLALIVLTAIIFWVSGGAALIGISALPSIGMGTWLLIIVGGAVLWMISESK